MSTGYELKAPEVETVMISTVRKVIDASVMSGER